MKKTYPTSTKSQQWAKHLRPFGKRQANKSTRKINKAITEGENETVKTPRKKLKPKFAIEYHTGNQVWRLWKKYISQGRRDRSLENLIKKHKNSAFESLRHYQFRKK